MKIIITRERDKERERERRNEPPSTLMRKEEETFEEKNDLSDPLEGRKHPVSTFST